MADLVPYRSQELARRQVEQIEYIVQVTQAAQRELGRIHDEGARLAIDTLTYTRERIQTAARNGMSEAKVEALVEQQKHYLAEMQEIAATGARELAGIVSNLPALPGN